jgi:threonine aldolase
VIDLRSDTVTQPTPAMRDAIANAAVGDEQEREDPTVLELERRAAAFLGQEEAVFVPTATMANQIALRILTRPGDEVLAEENSHVFLYEQGGPAVFSGLVMRGLPGHHGKIAPEQIRAAIRDWSSGHMPVTRLVSLENTHNSSGGRVWTLAEIDAVVATARELDLRVHLDGARIVNAATALGVPAAEIGRRVDTVTLCLSKGLGCPLGALVAGSAELMVAARRAKHLFGGAMRQAGIVAAAGVYALDHHVTRIADDHARARRLGEAWAAAGLGVDPEQVETNFVFLDVGPLGLTPAEALRTLDGAGVRLSDTVHPTILRAVTHLGISDEDVDRAAALVPQALGAANVPA